jgi:hypothetical protein
MLQLHGIPFDSLQKLVNIVTFQVRVDEGSADLNIACHCKVVAQRSVCIRCMTIRVAFAVVTR